MAIRAEGLIITPSLVQRQVRVTLNFEPSVGILARKIDKLGLNLKSFKEPLRESVKDVVIPSIRLNFDRGGRPKWRALSANTLAHKAKEGAGGRGILIRSGALRRQMGYLNTWTINSEAAMITDLPDAVWYGKVHQAGYGGTTSFTVKNTATGQSETFTEEADSDGLSIPARPFVVLQRGDITKIHKVFDRWLGRKIRAAGLASR
jgi:phage gpG-like protein